MRLHAVLTGAERSCQVAPEVSGAIAAGPMNP